MASNIQPPRFVTAPIFNVTPAVPVHHLNNAQLALIISAVMPIFFDFPAGEGSQREMDFEAIPIDSQDLPQSDEMKKAESEGNILLPPADGPDEKDQTLKLLAKAISQNINVKFSTTQKNGQTATSESQEATEKEALTITDKTANKAADPNSTESKIDKFQNKSLSLEKIGEKSAEASSKTSKSPSDVKNVPAEMMVSKNEGQQKEKTLHQHEWKQVKTPDESFQKSILASKLASSEASPQAVSKKEDTEKPLPVTKLPQEESIEKKTQVFPKQVDREKELNKDLKRPDDPETLRRVSEEIKPRPDIIPVALKEKILFLLLKFNLLFA